MFELERLSDASGRVLRTAQTHSRRLGHVWIGTEHLLLALADTPSGASSILEARGLTAEHVEASIDGLIDDEHAADRVALAVLGIDLDRVREAIQSDLRPEAPHVDDGRPARRWNRPRKNTGTARQIPFTPRAKKSFELAHREAIRLKQPLIHPEHILLGILRDGAGMAAAVLAENGISPDALRADLEASLRASA